MVNFENIKPFCDALRAADGGVVAALHVLASSFEAAESVGAVENLEHIIRQLEGISEHISALMLDRHAEALAAEEHKARTAKFRANDKPQTWQEVVEREVARLS